MNNATRNLGLILLVTMSSQNLFAADPSLDRQGRCMAKVIETAKKDASGKLDGGTPMSQIGLDGSIDSNVGADRTVTMSFDLNLYGGPAATKDKRRGKTFL